MQVTILKPFIEGWCIVWRSMSDIAFNDTKQLLLVGCREQLRKKDTVWLKSIKLDEKYKIKKIIIVLKCKNCFSLRNLTKISKSICVGVRQVTFLSEDWKKLSVWSNALFKVSALEIGGKKAYTGPNVSVLLNKIFHSMRGVVFSREGGGWYPDAHYVSAFENDRFMQILHTVS